ncbi:hypothetical protein Tco_1423411 [Tanacetum coccineum]
MPLSCNGNGGPYGHGNNGRDRKPLGVDIRKGSNQDTPHQLLYFPSGVGGSTIGSGPESASLSFRSVTAFHHYQAPSLTLTPLTVSVNHQFATLVDRVGGRGGAL